MRKLLTLSIAILSLFSCSEKEPESKCIDIIASISFEDKGIEHPEGYALLFDAELDDLKDSHLTIAGSWDDQMFALTASNGDNIFPKEKRKLSQTDDCSVGFISPANFYQDYPKDMLLYVYVYVPDADYCNMYSFKELTVGTQMYKLDKTFPLISYTPGEGSNTQYVVW